MSGLVVAMFACDRARVATTLVGFPSNEEIGLLPGENLHADYAAVLGSETPAMPAPENIRAGFVAWNVFAAKQVAALAHRLDTVLVPGGGTLLDHTIVLWTTSWAGPGNRWEPMGAVLLGGRALGLRGGRYLRMPQNVDVPFDVLGRPAMPVGPPHNRLLTSVARLVGVNVDAIGDRTLIRTDDSSLDLTGPLPGL